MRLALWLSLGALPLLTSLGSAQGPAPREPLKQGAPPAAPAVLCQAEPAPARPSEEQRRSARDLSQRALQAALLGDSAAARAGLREAAALDRTDADLAYRLGRAHEAVRAVAEAKAEYCRFLALAPDATEAPEVRARVGALAPASGPDARTSAAMDAFRAGIAAYESGRFGEAEAAFSAAMTHEPQWPEPHYNRAVTRIARGQRTAAVGDLEEFLRLKPETADRAAVVARVAMLRRATFSPNAALTRGLALPGGGHFYTKRPVRGAVTALAVGAALVVALVPRTTSSTVERTATDPFGNSYTYTATLRVKERPLAVPGAVAGIAIAVGSAVDAYRYAKRSLR